MSFLFFLLQTLVMHDTGFLAYIATCQLVFHVLYCLPVIVNSSREFVMVWICRQFI